MECCEVLAMSLLNVVKMSPKQREDRRELDEACFRSVEAYCADGVPRTKALTRAAASLSIKREDVVAGYWRHVRREKAK
jgi:predicted nuclease of restriction endonuclease-like RecB superfamily